MEKRLESPLRAAIDFLERRPYRYAVIGGIAISQYEEQIIERAVRRDLNGFSAWVCSANDLIIQKMYSGRGKDLLDVEALLIAQRGKLDETYIEDWLTQFAEALEKPEILAEYQRMLAESKTKKLD